ncbi:MAG: hypothetical protein JWM33_1515 [Caulobacteraceae bacterium]|nr:hypothetical protein [Caulobacteraceae bacterium]
MGQPASFKLEKREDGPVAVLTGDWTATTMGRAGQKLRRSISGVVGLDLNKIGRFDTAGALAVLRASQKAGLSSDDVKSRRQAGRLFDLVEQASQVDPPEPPRPLGVNAMLERIGRAILDFGTEFYLTLGFIGHLVAVVGRAIAHPRRIRWTAFVAQTERAGLDALPIIAVTSFFIGAVVALLGANLLTQFGAQVFAVELVGISVLREFNIIITGLLLAGRSASSFTAEIGSMKMNQEIDAMKVMGVDPYDALVAPRFFALMVMIPLLTFVASVSGLAGGMLVTWGVLDVSPTFFLQRIVDNVHATQFFIGMSQAPIVAAVVAAIGCRQGLTVGDDVESLGRKVTSSVVQAIFSIILVALVFALLYMEMGI